MNKCNFAVIGLGRIGLPIAIAAAVNGFNVIGIDKNKETVRRLIDKDLLFKEEGLQKKLLKTSNNTFFPYDADKILNEDLENVKYVTIAIGVQNVNRKYPEPFEYRPVRRIIDYLFEKNCIKGRIIFIRTTQPVGSTRIVRKIIEDKSGLIEGKDFYLAYMPERILEGSAIEEESQLPRIVGTFNDSSFLVAKEMLEFFKSPIKRVSSPEVAEFVKLLDNSWRHTRFAFANDVALAAENVGVDAIEAIEAANFEYPRNSIAFPGPISGYCLGKDPYIFEYAFRETELSRNFNSLWFYSILSSKYLLEHIISKIKGKDILIMGLSFKKNIDDYRLSHGVFLAQKMLEKGFSVTAFDNDYMTNDYTDLDKSIKNKLQVFSNFEDISDKKYSTVIISVANDEFKNMEHFLEKHDKVIDLWSMYKNKKDMFKSYWSLG